MTALAIAALDPRTIYVGVASGVFKSTDGGRNWHRSDGGLPHRPVEALDVDPENSDTVYVGIAEGNPITSRPNFFRSVDAGSSWRRLDSPNPLVGIHAVAVDPKRPRTIYAATDHGCTGCDLTGLFKSTDGGRSWQGLATYLEGDANLVVIDPVNPQHLYAQLDAGLETSTNGGKTWRLTSKRSPMTGLTALALERTNPHALYVGTDFGIAKTTDGGRSWRRASSGLPARAAVSALAIEPDKPHTILAAIGSGTKKGVFRSTNGGQSWKQLDWQLR